MRVACLLKTGGPDYTRWHVDRLRKMCAEFMPELEFVCFTDKPEDPTDVPLIGGWPGWWSKPELFRPGHGDLLYFDLDVALMGRPSFADAPPVKLTVLRAFEELGVKWPWARNSSVMLIPESAKAAVWEKWLQHPEKWMEMYPRGDDFWLARETTSLAIQDEFPDECVSFKYRVLQLNEITEDNKVIVFHGQPRPWAIDPNFLTQMREKTKEKERRFTDAA